MKWLVLALTLLFAITPAAAWNKHGYGGVFVPTLPLIGDLVTHLAATDITGLSSGSAVSSWTAGTGGQIFTQATGADQPTYVTNRLNGLPSVQFNGTSDSICLTTDPGTALGNVLLNTTPLGYTIAIIYRTLGSKTNGTLLASYNAVDAQVNLLTSAPTTSGGTLNFGASVPATVVNGMAVTDNTTSGVIPNGTTVTGVTGSTVQISNNVTGGGVVSGDNIGFGTSVAGNDLWFIADGTNVVSGVDPMFKTPYAGQTSYSTMGAIAYPDFPYGAATKFTQFFINGGIVDQSGENTLGLSPPASTNSPLCFGTTANNNTHGNVEVFDFLLWNAPLSPIQLIQFQQWADYKYGQPDPWASQSKYYVFNGSSLLTADAVGGNLNELPPYIAAADLGLSFGQWMNLGVGGINLTDMNIVAEAISSGGFGWIDPLPAYLGKTVINVTQEWYNSALSNPYPAPFEEAYSYVQARKQITNLKIVFTESLSYGSEPTPAPTNRSEYDQALLNNTTNSTAGNVLQYIDSLVSLSQTGCGSASNGYCVADPNIGTIGAASTQGIANGYYAGDQLHLSVTGAADLGNYFYQGILALP